LNEGIQDVWATLTLLESSLMVFIYFFKSKTFEQPETRFSKHGAVIVLMLKRSRHDLYFIFLDRCNSHSSNASKFAGLLGIMVIMS